MKKPNIISCLLIISLTSFRAEALDFIGDLSEAIGEVSKSTAELAKTVESASNKTNPAPTQVTSVKATPFKTSQQGSVIANSLFDESNLDTQISFLKKKFSLTSSKITDTSEFFEIDGCSFEFGLDKNKNVSFIKAYPSNECVIETGFGKSNSVTIDNLIDNDRENKNISRLLVECVSGCGNSQDPKSLYLATGAHVNGYVARIISFYNVEGSDDWKDKIKAALGLDNLDDDEAINCNTRFDKSGMDLLKKGNVDSVTIAKSDVLYSGEFPVECKMLKENHSAIVEDEQTKHEREIVESVDREVKKLTKQFGPISKKTGGLKGFCKRWADANLAAMTHKETYDACIAEKGISLEY